MSGDADIKPMHTFNSGARRSEVMPRYDLIPHEGLKRLAERYSIGAKIYGEWNWQKGLDDREFVQQLKCHIAEHMAKFFSNGSIDDDHLAAIAWGCFALMERERLYGIDANKPGFRQPGGPG